MKKQVMRYALILSLVLFLGGTVMNILNIGDGNFVLVLGLVYAGLFTTLKLTENLPLFNIKLQEKEA